MRASGGADTGAAGSGTQREGVSWVRHEDVNEDGVLLVSVKSGYKNEEGDRRVSSYSVTKWE